MVAAYQYVHSNHTSTCPTACTATHGSTAPEGTYWLPTRGVSTSAPPRPFEEAMEDVQWRASIEALKRSRSREGVLSLQGPRVPPRIHPRGVRKEARWRGTLARA